MWRSGGGGWSRVKSNNRPLDPLNRLVQGEDAAVPFGPARDTESRRQLALLPGAFDPLHAGHLEMAQRGEQFLQQTVHFELSMVNVDKQPLDKRVVMGRAEQFRSDQSLWITQAATFVEKSNLFPEATFLVGVDTVLRVGNAKYYAADPKRMRQSICQLAEMSCRFLVFGRLLAGKFVTLADTFLEPALRELCEGVSERDFRNDTSSTELRRPNT